MMDMPNEYTLLLTKKELETFIAFLAGEETEDESLIEMVRIQLERQDDKED